ncbi:MAG: DUF488 family protein, N3 subclade [Acidimicrobiales bacterium]
MWCGHVPDRFPTFARRYHSELASLPASSALVDLYRRSASCTLVLLNATKDVDRSSAAVLRDILTRRPPRTRCLP